MVDVTLRILVVGGGMNTVKTVKISLRASVFDLIKVVHDIAALEFANYLPEELGIWKIILPLYPQPEPIRGPYKRYYRLSPTALVSDCFEPEFIPHDTDTQEAVVMPKRLRRSMPRGVNKGIDPYDKLWEDLWLAREDTGVPFFQKHPIYRDGTLQCTDAEVSSAAWSMQIPHCVYPARLTQITHALVRSDYFEAFRSLFQAAGTVNPVEVRFTLTGGPAIGKTFWLILVLVLRLHARLPTAYQVRPNQILFFDEHGVQELFTLKGQMFDIALRRHEPGDVWALVDSNECLQGADDRYHFSKMFIVEATTLDSEGGVCKGELASRRVSDFILDPWTISDIICARGLIRDKVPSERAMKEFMDKYGAGASPRDVYIYANAPAAYEDRAMTLLSTLSAASPSNPIIVYELSIKLGLVVLRRTAPISCDLYTPQLVSKHIANLVAGTSLLSDELVQSLFKIFLIYMPYSRQSAAWVLEAHARRFIRPEGTSWGLLAPKGEGTFRYVRWWETPVAYLAVSPGAKMLSVGVSPLVYSDIDPESVDGQDSDNVIECADVDYLLLYSKPDKHAVIFQPRVPVDPPFEFECTIKRRLRELRERGTQRITYIIVPLGCMARPVFLKLDDLVDECYEAALMPDCTRRYGMFI
ncbi:unnamed protein product [Cyclocybe aegerita]|uniref:Uncharacterized protein n=1 Tax=Cyclocybe aegerita TaxID=1973307 RepID=A0A8S0VXL6_CYCAE|nr:unnamed protein product [Cyclocybe aegerita]